MSLEVFTTIAIVGATGAVGREALAILAARGVPKERIVPLASERSVGMCLPYGDDAVIVRALTHEAVESCDAAIFAASADIAKEYGPRAAAKGLSSLITPQRSARILMCRSLCRRSTRRESKVRI